MNASLESLAADLSASQDSYPIQYYLYDYWILESDPRTRHYHLSRGGPERCVPFMLLWLLFVTKLGPYLMRDRKPMGLRSVMFVYNVLMVCCNAYFFCLSLRWLNYGRRLADIEFPSREDYSPETLQRIDEYVLYAYTKYFDLLDTVFMVLRKKSRHLSFLHVYHHFLVPILGWSVIKLAPTVTPIAVFTLLNSFCHTIMYTYYALAAFGPNIQKYLWWKRYITMAQIIQFAIFNTYGAIHVFLSKGYPSGLFWSVQVQNPLFLYLFWDFYRKSYLSSSKLKNN